jgi:hypothetical protein
MARVIIHDPTPHWGYGPGGETLRFVFGAMRIDEQWSTRDEDGFTWWPHRQRQRVWESAFETTDGLGLSRLAAETEIAHGVPDRETRAMLAFLNQNGSLSAYARTPDGRVVLRCSVVIHEQNLAWAKRLFMLAAALQPIEAYRATSTLVSLGGGAAHSAHPASGPRAEPDELVAGVLQVVDAAAERMRAEGRRTPISGLSPLPHLAGLLERHGCSAQTSDRDLLARIPCGDGEALLEIRAHDAHPVYGPGVFFLLRLPFHGPVTLSGHPEPLLLRSALNHLATAPSLGAGSTHALGGWSIHPDGNGDTTRITFLPACLCESGIVLNLGLATALAARRIGEVFQEERRSRPADGGPIPLPALLL